VEKIGLARERYRKPIKPTMELHTSKLGSEKRGRSIGSARSRIDADTSSCLPKPSKQDKGTQATSSLQQDLLKVKPVAIDSAVDCLRKRLGGVRLHPHGGLISRRGAEILTQIFLRPPTSPGKFGWIMRFGALGASASPFFNGFRPYWRVFLLF
jgi:hypothetical protein